MVCSSFYKVLIEENLLLVLRCSFSASLHKLRSELMQTSMFIQKEKQAGGGFLLLIFVPLWLGLFEIARYKCRKEAFSVVGLKMHGHRKTVLTLSTHISCSVCSQRG